MPRLGPTPAYIFRITHVENVAWILRNGLRCAKSHTLDPHFVPIGNAEFIQKQRDHVVPIPPAGTVSDYVRFYFTPWSIMLYNIKTGFHGITRRENREVVILVSTLHKISSMGLKFVFTDQHAYGVESTYYNDLKDLDKIDWELLRSRDFKTDPEDPGKKGEVPGRGAGTSDRSGRGNSRNHVLQSVSRGTFEIFRSAGWCADPDQSSSKLVFLK